MVKCPRAIALRGLALALALAAGGACSSTPRRTPGAETVPQSAQVVLAPEGAAAQTVTVEVMRTKAQRNRGLMFRSRLDGGQGMLFLFPSAAHQIFWMHNTYIPLDMIFIDANMKVVGFVEQAEPLTDTPRAVDGDSQYVLEVPGGWSAAHRIAPGTPVTFQRVDLDGIEKE
jgi:uncharacterized membrane protein (UPF0127 family)